MTRSTFSAIVIFASLVVLFGNAAQSQATLWNVDLVSASGSMSGAGVVGSAGDSWNVFNTGDGQTALTVVDSSGVSGASDIGLFIDKPGGNQFGFGAEATSNPMALMDGFGSSVNNGLGTSAAQQSFAFSGLVPNTQYSVTAYGASQSGTDRGTFFFDTVNGLILGYTDGSSTDITSAATYGLGYLFCDERSCRCLHGLHQLQQQHVGPRPREWISDRGAGQYGPGTGDHRHVHRERRDVAGCQKTLDLHRQAFVHQPVVWKFSLGHGHHFIAASQSV